ncbi:hypothetical protein ACFQY0_17775 [Haloferula chungangensis]|uniref:Uncharacterized protein n=1 Tax=Haloferula chungangensis TaxID=1048331 RepID=A0ABW2LDL0_9BACT
MKMTFRFAIVAAALGLFTSAAMAGVDCLKLSVSVKHAVAAAPADVLQIVEREVGANSSCACEIVKAAIEASKADAAQVAAIVEVAGTVAPDQLRLVSQCAVAVAPDALVEVQSVTARLDPNKGDTSYEAESAKGSKTPVAPEPAWNPLNFPGAGPVGPNPGGPGGSPILPFTPMPTPTPNIRPVNPPAGTDTDPMPMPPIYSGDTGQ